MSSNTPPDNQELELLRALARAWHGLERHASAHVRAAKLSVPQFEILCCLGDAGGMTFTELGERTLIYKTTLTGVVDRLESKNLVRRQPCERDRRCIYVVLTEQGERRYRELAPVHRDNLKRRLQGLSEADKRDATRLLNRLKDLF
jgi:DNA-binding MarR family transcriptional regulator